MHLSYLASIDGRPPTAPTSKRADKNHFMITLNSFSVVVSEKKVKSLADLHGGSKMLSRTEKIQLFLHQYGSRVILHATIFSRSS